MKSEHLLYIGIGVILGWLVVPMIMGMIGSKKG